MQSPEAREKLAALEKARAELAAGLSGDAHWLALAEAAANGAGAEARAREEAALAANPLYLAIKHLDEAIAALREARDEAPTAAAPSPAFPAAADDGAPADDLTRIRGVSPTLARRLGVLGVTSFAQVAEWNADDVRTMSDALGLDREISRQNWIEQAALLLGRKSGVRSAAAAIPAVASWDAAAPKAEDQPAPAKAPEAAPAKPQDAAPGGQGEEERPAAEEVAAADGETPDASELPENIRTLIRNRADAIAAGEPDDTDEAAGKDAGAAEETKAPATNVIALVPPADGARAGEGLDAADRAQRLEEELRRLAAEAPANPADPAADDEDVTMPAGNSPRFFEREAKVTFIVREPRMISPGERPPANGADRPAVSIPEVEPFAPNERAEEAEVTIVKAGEEEVPKKQADRPPSTVRRFLKALSGD